MQHNISHVQVDKVVTLRDRKDGITTKHLVKGLVRRNQARWTLYCGALEVPYRSEHYTIERVADDWSDD